MLLIHIACNKMGRGVNPNSELLIKTILSRRTIMGMEKTKIGDSELREISINNVKPQSGALAFNALN